MSYPFLLTTFLSLELRTQQGNKVTGGEEWEPLAQGMGSGAVPWYLTPGVKGTSVPGDARQDPGMAWLLPGLCLR